MTNKTYSARELHKTELDYMLKEFCGVSLLEVDEDNIITGLYPDIDEISLMNQVDFMMKQPELFRDDN